MRVKNLEKDVEVSVVYFKIPGVTEDNHRKSQP